MTLQEALSTGVSVTGIGLAIVFSVLVILMLVMILMKKIFYKEPKTETVQPNVTTTQEPETEDEEELIAVLTAAVAASLNTSTYNLKIKSYRRITNSTSMWNRVGIEDTINSRL